MQIKEIKNKEQWEQFFSGIQEKTFLNSWNWGDFWEMLGNKVWRFGVYHNDQLISLFTVIKKEAKSGHHLFIPYGPTIIQEFQNQKTEILKSVISYLTPIAQEEKATFLRFVPISFLEDKKIYSDLGFVQAPTFVHPNVTWILDLEKNEEELLSGMRKTTRYMIKQGQKAGIQIIKTKDLQYLDAYNRLNLETVKRHNFTPFSLEYLQKEVKAFGSDDQVLILLAQYQNEIIAGAIIVFWQGTAYYHHGASDNSKYPKIGAAYFLQWEIVKEAQKRGCKVYNFWGIEEDIKDKKDLNDTDLKKHPWWGLSLFKMGFGGKVINYLKTQDYPLKSSYWFTYIFEFLRRKQRRL